MLLFSDDAVRRIEKLGCARWSRAGGLVDGTVEVERVCVGRNDGAMLVGDLARAG